MCMEHWWNDPDGETELLGENNYTGWFVDYEWVCSIITMIQKGNSGVLGEKQSSVWVLNEWMCMVLWWKILRRENRSRERNPSYSLGGSWINVYGAVVEWYWQRKQKNWEKKLLSLVGRKINENGAIIQWYRNGKR